MKKRATPLVLSSLVSLFLCLFLAACESPPEGRIMGDNERDLVDASGAGAATFQRLVTESVAKLLDRHCDKHDVKVYRLAFVDLQNRTSEELGEWREQLIDKILIGVDKHRAFRIISEQMVSAVLREMGNPPVDRLFLPEGRREFAKILERDSIPLQFLMYGRITRGGTNASEVRQANYLLTLELVDAETGEADTVGAEVRKEFTQ